MNILDKIKRKSISDANGETFRNSENVLKPACDDIKLLHDNNLTPSGSPAELSTQEKSFSENIKTKEILFFFDALPPIPCTSCAGKRFWVPVGEEKLICVKCSPPEFVSLRQYEVEIVEAFEGERYFAKVGKAQPKAPNGLADARASGLSNDASAREGRAAAKGRRCPPSGFLVGSESYERWLERSSASWAKVQERSLLGGSRQKPALKDGQCRKCHGMETKAVPIHGGQSERLDCARCGAFVRFGRWAGSDLQAVVAT